MLEWVMGLWFHSPHLGMRLTRQIFCPRVGKYIAVIHTGIHTLIKWDSPFTFQAASQSLIGQKKQKTKKKMALQTYKCLQHGEYTAGHRNEIIYGTLNLHLLVH